MTLATRLLLLCAWIGATALIFCLYMIARFFQQKSEQRSYYQLFLIPLVLYLIAALRSFLPSAEFADTPLVNGLLFLAGAGTMALGAYLLNLMTGGQK